MDEPELLAFGRKHRWNIWTRSDEPVDIKVSTDDFLIGSWDVVEAPRTIRATEKFTIVIRRKAQ
jgi:hypothetical protein